MRKLPKPPAATKERKPRRAFVLVAVLFAIVILLLAAYQYGDLMSSEYRAADNAHRMAQARSFADSGIHYAAAMLSNPNNVNGLNGNYWNNPQFFYDIQVPTDDQLSFPGRFTLIAPLDPSDTDTSQGWRFGVVDEGAKLNINVQFQLDPTGQTLYNALVQLPNMTTDIANAIVNWMLVNGSFDTLEELLLVPGVSPVLMFGSDLNHNGFIEPEEDTGNGPYDFGWSAFLTIYSRELNNDLTGTPYFWLNDTDTSTLYTNLTTQVDPTVAAFVILYRQYGPTASTGTGAGGTSGGATTPAAAATTTGGKITVTLTPTTGGGNSSNTPVAGDLTSVTPDFTKAANTKIKSIWQLINAQVTVPSTTAGQPSTIYTSPLSDPNNQTTLLPLLFSTSTVVQGNEIPARININTAPLEVLSILLAFQPNLQQTDVQTILLTRPTLDTSGTSDPIFQTPAWLLTQANLSPTVLAQLDQYVTTKTQVYRVQSVGYFEDAGPAARVEAIIDTNGGRPCIMMWRDLTPLGKGWSKQQ